MTTRTEQSPKYLKEEWIKPFTPEHQIDSTLEDEYRYEVYIRELGKIIIAAKKYSHSEAQKRSLLLINESCELEPFNPADQQHYRELTHDAPKNVMDPMQGYYHLSFRTPSGLLITQFSREVWKCPSLNQKWNGVLIAENNPLFPEVEVCYLP